MQTHGRNRKTRGQRIVQHTIVCVWGRGSRCSEIIFQRSVRTVSGEYQVDVHLIDILDVLVNLIHRYLEDNCTLHFSLGWF